MGLSFAAVTLVPVTRYDAISRCSVPRGPSFRWYGSPLCEPGDDIATAVDALFASLVRPGRLWNPFAKQMAKSEFKARIKKASEGRLQPIDEVKPVDVRNPPPLYEIRWQGISVTDLADDGASKTFSEVLVRMYHSEPASKPSHFIGHHAHEKLIDVPDINATQQAEIRKAIAWYRRGEPSDWGIASPAA